MNKRQLTLITLITILSLYSCKKELSDLGSDLIPSSQKFVFSTDTLKSIELNTVSNPYCSFATYIASEVKTKTMLLGSYTDSRFGNITSDYACDILPSFYKQDSFKNISSIESVILTLDSRPLKTYTTSTYIGDTTNILDFNLRYLKTAMKEAVNYTITEVNDASIGLKGDIIQSISTKLKDTVSITLDNLLGRKLVGLDQEDKTIFDSEASYREYVKGIYIETLNKISDNCLSKYSLANSYITVKCKEDEKVKSRVFYLFSSLSKNIITRDFSTADFVSHIDEPLKNDTVAYTSTLNGPMIEISKDTLENWKKRMLAGGSLDETTSSSNLDIAINRAEMLIYAAPKELTNIESLSRVKNLKLVAVVEDTSKVNKTANFYISQASFNADKGAYLFDITSFVHKYLRDQINPQKLIISTDLFDPNESVELFNDKRTILYNNKSSKSPVILISYTKLQ